MKITMTRELAQAASFDAANQQMRKADRKQWNRDDYDAAWKEFGRLWPKEKDGR